MGAERDERARDDATDCVAERAEVALREWRRRPIVLVGFMGAGKSSVGRLLAQRLGRRFHDSDEVVESQLGASVAALFASRGEAQFRRIEAETIARLVGERPPAVVALGGGALETAGTAELVARDALVVYLELDPADLLAELPALREGRPLLAARGAEEVRALLERRRPTYARAHLQVPPARSGPERAVEVILERLGAAGA